MAKIEAHRVPGLGQLIRAFGTFSVRRGESDREAVRMMRRIVAEGKALGLFVEGTRQKSGIPGEVKPGAAMVAVQEDDLVVFMTDARAGVTPGDEEIAAILRAARKPVLLVANKIDDPARDDEALEFHRLGLGDPIPLSALHGHGTGDLLDRIVELLPGTAPDVPGEEAIRVAILGRPNVGKSSLLNALLGRERVIVSEVPGTTRDAIDTVLRRDDRTFVLVDTAGLRRKRRQRQGIEYYSELRALQAAERADVALVLIDSSEGVLYGAQVRTRPPRFRIHVSDPRLVTRDYGYWIENELRRRFALEGVPVSIDFVPR